MAKTYKRRKILISPKIQLLSGLVFMSTASVYVLFQAILLNRMVAETMQKYPGHDPELLDSLLSGIMGNLAVTFLILVPVSMICATLLTFRFVGPIYRFKRYIMEILDGTDPGPCHVRKQDEFKDVAELFTLLRNRAAEHGFFDEERDHEKEHDAEEYREHRR